MSPEYMNIWKQSVHGDFILRLPQIVILEGVLLPLAENVLSFYVVRK